MTTPDACNMNRLAAIFCGSLRILRDWCREVSKQKYVGAVNVLVFGERDPGRLSSFCQYGR
jgi:predicted secreted protein